VAKTHCKHGHEFSDDNVYCYKGRQICRVCARARTAAWRSKNWPSVSVTAWRRNVGKLAKQLSIKGEQVQKLREANCEICGEQTFRHGKSQCHIDHDHKTGKVRGSLCSACNMGLGKFKDSEQLLLSAISYLRRKQDAAA
jgi:hypothetical protein